MSSGDAAGRTLGWDRALTLSGILVLSALAWAYIVHLSRDMGQMDMGMAMPQLQAWTPADLLLLFVMWAVMMVAMMLPSAAPVVLLFRSIERRRRAQRRPAAPTALFVLGYLLVWSAYSALATGAQWALHSAALLSEMMVSTSGILGGVLLVAAGAFQWTPLKTTCLSSCRSPLGWLTTEWREGRAGALSMGIRHGGYCVGCCWALMALLFVVGVMNLLWIAALAALVLVEKIAPAGPAVARAAGVLLVGWGTWLLLGALV